MALLSTVLVGFVGLVIDGGEIASRQQGVQGVADGAAVTAAYGIGRQNASLATATTLAQNVPVRVGFPATDLTMSYLNAAGVVTVTPSLVRTVQAVVADTRPTYFVAVIGIPSVQVTATARATVWPACVLCVGAATGTALSLNASSTVTVTGGPVVVNSNATPAITLGNSAKLTAPVITFATGGSYTVGTGTTLTPTPVAGPTFTDPFAGLPAPSVAGAPKAFNSGGNGNISPGNYTTITVNSGDTITMLTGTYVVSGFFDVAGTLLTGAGGVIVYFVCPAGPCSGAGTGGYLGVVGGTATITAATSGIYAGISVLSDPGDKSLEGTFNGALTVNGAYQTPAMPFQLFGSADSVTFKGITVLSTLVLGATSELVTVNVPSSGTFANPGLLP
jgi:hypothetical protein